MVLSNKQIVIAGIDGSDAALIAGRWAAADAIHRGAVLRLVQAFQAPPASGYPDPVSGSPQAAP